MSNIEREQLMTGAVGRHIDRVEAYRVRLGPGHDECGGLGRRQVVEPADLGAGRLEESVARPQFHCLFAALLVGDPPVDDESRDAAGMDMQPRPLRTTCSPAISH